MKKSLSTYFINLSPQQHQKLICIFEEVIEQILINPSLYPYSDKNKNLKRCVISPQTTLYYRFNGEFVELASFMGNRMNPETLGL